MAEIILPADADEEQEPDETEEIKYQATEKDEEVFFLMYHLHLQPSEIEKFSDDYRKWIIARFVAQKGLEREALERHRLMNQIMPNLKA